MNGMENILLKQVDENKSPSIQYILFDKECIIKSYCNGFVAKACDPTTLRRSLMTTSRRLYQFKLQHKIIFHQENSQESPGVYQSPG